MVSTLGGLITGVVFGVEATGWHDDHDRGRPG